MSKESQNRWSVEMLDCVRDILVASLSKGLAAAHKEWEAAYVENWNRVHFPSVSASAIELHNRLQFVRRHFASRGFAIES